jgi:hypothetical protein
MGTFISIPKLSEMHAVFLKFHYPSSKIPVRFQQDSSTATPWPILLFLGCLRCLPLGLLLLAFFLGLPPLVAGNLCDKGGKWLVHGIESIDNDCCMDFYIYSDS